MKNKLIFEAGSSERARLAKNEFLISVGSNPDFELSDPPSSPGDKGVEIAILLTVINTAASLATIISTIKVLSVKAPDVVIKVERPNGEIKIIDVDKIDKTHFIDGE